MVEVRLEQAAPLFLAELARLDCGGTGITHRDSVDADGNWRYPIGAGPFRWGEWRHQQYIDLPRFDGHRRSEESRVVEECDRTCSSLWWPDTLNKKSTDNTSYVH